MLLTASCTPATKAKAVLLLKTVITVLLFLNCTILAAQKNTPQHTSNNRVAGKAIITINDFKPLQGRWKGTLTYLDYSSNKAISIPANAQFSMENDSILVRNLFYTDEPDKNEKDSFIISAKGTRLNGDKLIKKNILANGTIEIVLQGNGTDGNDNKEAVFKHRWIISDNQLIIIKQVKYRAEDTFFERHRYTFSRQAD